MNTIKHIFLLISLCSFNIVFAQTIPPPPPYDTSNDIKIFTRVEVEAKFPGGTDGWRKFLTHTLNPDVPQNNGAPSGRYNTVAKFIVNKDGSISNIAVETNEGYGMEEEVIRTLKKSGSWIPAEQNGRKVNAYRRQPITFIVMGDDFDVTSRTPYTLFAGADNEVTITVAKVKMEDVAVTISKGTIKAAGEGKYIVRVAGKERVIITLINTKKNKPIGAAGFEVK